MAEPRSIAEFVDVAVRRARAGWIGESLALGLAAAIAVDVAALASGAPWSDPASLAASALGGVACAATWWVERRRDRLEVARSLDRRLAQDGALTTALELGEREGSDSFARVLAQRALAMLPARAVARAVPSPSPAFVAAPLIAAAVLAFALERAPSTSSEVRRLAGRAADSLSAAAEANRDDSALAEDLRDVAAQLRKVAERGQAVSPELERRARELDHALADRLQSDPPAGAAREQLATARDATSALLAQAAGAGGVEGIAGITAENGSSQSPDSSALARDAAARTMSGPPQRTESSRDVIATTEPSSSAPHAEPGTTAGRWWPPQYDAIVARFAAAREATEQR